MIHTKFWYNAENTPICYAFDTPDMLLFYRFQSVYDLLEGNLLANPAQADENGAYVYDANATAMIKNELVSGRAVTFGFLADQAQPGQELSPNSLLSFRDENGQKTDMNSAAIWAQYTYDKTYDPSDPGSVNHKVFNINHAACIVGYDDNFPKEYFNDPNGTLAGDGAWLVKNSWGSINAEDPAQRKHWGNSGETAECPFTDVTENAGAVGWAYKKGIIGGEPGSAFSPDKTEMREEFITMLYRWRWQSDGYIDRTVGVFREKLTDETAKVRYFSDARSIAYMSIADYYSIMLPGYTMKVTAEGSGKYKLTNACGSAVADVEKDTFH